MAKMNVSLQDDVHEALLKLIPARKRSEVINDALRKELLRRKRVRAAERIKQVRRRTATLAAEEIVATVRKDRRRSVT